MSRYDDPAIRERAYQLGGRVMLAVREAKRAEAAERQARTPHDHTRAHRLGRCACWLPERAERDRGRHRQPVCPWPGKVAYATPQDAAWTLAGMLLCAVLIVAGFEVLAILGRSG